MLYYVTYGNVSDELKKPLVPANVNRFVLMREVSTDEIENSTLECILDNGLIAPKYCNGSIEEAIIDSRAKKMYSLLSLKNVLVTKKQEGAVITIDEALGPFCAENQVMQVYGANYHKGTARSITASEFNALKKLQAFMPACLGSQSQALHNYLWVEGS